MKAFIVAALLALSSFSVPAKAAECDPKFPTVSEVHEQVLKSQASGGFAEELSGKELLDFRAGIEKEFKTQGKNLLEFDQHVFFAERDNPIGLAIMIKEGCVVKGAPIPVEMYVKFRTYDPRQDSI